MSWYRLLSTLSIAALFGTASLVAAVGSANAGDTWCVGAQGECNTRAVRRMHGDWHFHTHVTDGTNCFECYDEEDNTCESGFLSATPGWSALNEFTCVLVGAAPPSEGVRFHRIDGQDVVAPPPPPQQIEFRTEVGAPSGPHALGDTIRMSVRLVDADGDPRGFSGGDLVLLDQTGGEVARLPVTETSTGEGYADVLLEHGGELKARFEVRDPALRKGETLKGTAAADLDLEVGECPFRGNVNAVDPIVLQGESILLSGSVRSDDGNEVNPAELSGADLVFVLSMDEGADIRVPARFENGQFVADLTFPSLSGELVAGQVHLTGGGPRPICPGVSRTVQVSSLPVVLNPTAPAQCWTGLPCRVDFEVLVPGRAAAAAADRFLQSAELKVSAKVGGASITPNGSVMSRHFEVEYQPTQEGTASFRLSMETSDQTVGAIAQVPIAQSILLSLPSQLDLGNLAGGAEIESTCRALDFSGSQGAVAAQFTVELASACPDCGVELVSASPGQAEHFPMTIMVGLDQEVPVCAAIGRCPTGRDGASQTLIVRPVAGPFADQEARIEVTYEVSGRSALSCWGWLIKSVAAAVIAVVWLYGFIRPYAFEAGTVVRVSGSEKTLRRAGRQDLADMKGGRKRWYRSAAVHLDADGSPVGSASRGLLTLAATGTGTVLRTGAPVLRVDPRTRRMAPVDSPDLQTGLVLQRGRVYQVGSLWLRMGS